MVTFTFQDRTFTIHYKQVLQDMQEICPRISPLFLAVAKSVKCLLSIGHSSLSADIEPVYDTSLVAESFE
jgi:hypothetical protein